MIPVLRATRIAAFALDVVFLLLLMGFAPLVCKLLKFIHEWIPVIEIPRENEHAFYGMLVLVLLFEAITGLTPGKVMLSITPSTPQGEQGNTLFYMKRFLLRYALGWIILAINLLTKSLQTGMIFVILSVCMIYVLFNVIFFFTPEKSSLHDKLLKSIVIDRRYLIKINP